MSRDAKGGRLRIGTRGSPLALAQTAAVCQALSRARGLTGAAVEVKVIKTTGDQIQDRLLADVGGKGLFTKEIEAALASGEIDIAVHSAKDMPTMLPDGLVISAYLEREDVRDALVSRNGQSFADLPRGAGLGTGSIRREAQAMRLRPDIEIRPLRGNVHTRLRKVEDGEFDATILGMAGLNRLGLAAAITQILPVADFLPAVGQGAVAIETREDDSETRELLAAINHAPTGIAVTMERAFLAVLDGSCRTPIAGYAVLSGVEFVFRGMILPPLGGAIYETERTGTIEHASRLCADAGAELKRRAGADFMVQAV
jgi:hydroxymethylbilane synthase